MRRATRGSAGRCARGGVGRPVAGAGTDAAIARGRRSFGGGSGSASRSAFRQELDLTTTQMQRLRATVGDVWRAAGGRWRRRQRESAGGARRTSSARASPPPPTASPG